VAIVTLTYGEPESKERLLTSGGYELFDAQQWPVLTVCTTETDVTVNIKFLCGGGAGTELESYFTGNSRAFARNPPQPDGDFIYLASDSYTIGIGPEPFDEGSRVIAVEILRKPTN